MTACLLGAAAQQRFDYVERRNPWNASLNAAGVRQDTLSRSYAELFFTKENGGFADFSASDDSWTAGARTESIRHFSKVSFAGGFEYDYFDGRNMSGSMFVDPGYYPMDILEFTPGRKILENYAFTGAVSAVLGTHWTGGLKIDFAARNYAKRKDLRHKNTRLDFEFSPGVLYHRGPVAVGLAYVFGKNSENVKASEIGTTPDSYNAFLDKGLGFGVLEQWDGSGIHLEETGAGVSGFPVKELVHGVSAQLQYGAFFAEVTYRDRSGRSGEKETWWHEFSASVVEARAALAVESAACSHFIRLNLDWESLDNEENILRRESVNGVTTVRYFGSVPIFGRRSTEAGGEYELRSKRVDLRVGAAWEKLARRSTLLFPYVREQDMHAMSLFARAIVTLGAWELTAAADWRRGDFSENAYELGTPLETSEYPMQLTEYYQYATEYFTAPRLGAELGLRRNIKRFYVDLSARYERGFDLVFIPQADRVRATLAVGYNF